MPWHADGGKPGEVRWEVKIRRSARYCQVSVLISRVAEYCLLRPICGASMLTSTTERATDWYDESARYRQSQLLFFSRLTARTDVTPFRSVDIDARIVPKPLFGAIQIRLPQGLGSRFLGYRNFRLSELRSGVDRGLLLHIDAHKKEVVDTEASTHDEKEKGASGALSRAASYADFLDMMSTAHATSFTRSDAARRARVRRMNRQSKDNRRIVHVKAAFARYAANSRNRSRQQPRTGPKCPIERPVHGRRTGVEKWQRVNYVVIARRKSPSNRRKSLLQSPIPSRSPFPGPRV